MDLVRRAMWGCKPTSLPEERSCIGVVSNSSVLCELRDAKVGQTCVRAPRGEWEDRLTDNLKKWEIGHCPVEPLYVANGQREPILTVDTQRQTLPKQCKIS
jgi:hypothetical protein